MVPGRNARAGSVTQDTSGRPSVVGAFGRFAVDFARGVVIHFVEGSLQLNELGLNYERQLRLEGDRLLLTGHHSLSTESSDSIGWLGSV